jgi:hypothetical protein
MWRCLAFAFSGVCLLLALATAVLWARSYLPFHAGVWTGSGDTFTWDDPLRPYVSVGSSSGALYLVYEGLSERSRASGLARAMAIPGPYRVGPWAFSVHQTPYGVESVLACPHWFAMTALIAVGCSVRVPSVCRAYRAHSRRRHTQCQTCGYDLRASPDRCPECGTPRAAPDGASTDPSASPPAPPRGVARLSVREPMGTSGAQGGRVAMWRWLIYALSVLCLILVVGTVALWVRSYWVRDSLGYTVEAPYAFTSISTAPGEIVFIRTNAWALGIMSKEPPKGWHRTTSQYASMPAQFAPKEFPVFSVRFVWQRVAPPFGGEPGLIIALPTWVPFLLLSIVAVVPAVRPWRRHRRRKRGLCEKCGYDLRASPERCPECGTPRAGAYNMSAASPDARTQRTQER